MRFWLCLLLLLPLSTLADDRADEKPGTMTVHGEAITKAAPDEVTLPVTIREENINIKAAKEKHDKKLNDLLKLAETMGIAKDDIQTSFTSISPQYDYRDHGKPKLLDYRVETSIDFRLDDISKLADFLDRVINLGITEIGDVSYSLKNEERIKEDTLAKAMTKAYEKAMRLATAAKVTLDKPVAIEEGGNVVNRFPPRPVRMMASMAMPMASSAPTPELPAGLIEVQQDVTVTYQLK